MTHRNFEKELCYSRHIDMEDGNDTESIDYPSLFSILEEFCDRIEQLEKDKDFLLHKLEELQDSHEHLKTKIENYETTT